MGLSHGNYFFPSHLNDDTTKQEFAPASMPPVVRRHCSEVYYHNTEDDRDSIVKQSVVQNGCESTITGCLQRAVDALRD